MLNIYVDAIQQHVNESTEDLDTLYAILKERSWTRVERKGYYKPWLKLVLAYLSTG